MKCPILSRRGLLLFVLLMGCTVQTESAKTVPPGEVATISFARGSTEIDIRRAAVDGTSVSSSLDSVQVAPGRHSVAVVYVVTVSDLCDGLQELCPTSTIHGVCEGDFEVASQQERVVALDGTSGRVRGVVRPPRKFSDLFADAPEPSAHLTCHSGSAVEGATRNAM
jgi:hypothetical protein